jgi:RimJ/RimL family protein N-acetyltransferase
MTPIPPPMEQPALAYRSIRTGRLVMRPAAFADLPGFIALKSDPRAYAMMLGGVRSPAQAATELAEDILGWGRHGIGIWGVHSATDDAFLGMAGVVARPDGRGMALRFAFWPEARGHGLAREAATAALHFGHERAGLPRIVAVAREMNLASRLVLSGIGMREEPEQSFHRDGYRMVVYASGAATAERPLPVWQPLPAMALA